MDAFENPDCFTFLVSREQIVTMLRAAAELRSLPGRQFFFGLRREFGGSFCATASK